MITLPKLMPYSGDTMAPSVNRDARQAQAIQGIVLHATQDAGNEAEALAWLRSPKSRASCHLLVGRSGRVTRLVGDQQRAWHAGQSYWRGTSDVNSITLGIEIANRNDGEPYTGAQYRRVAAIVAHYCRQGLALADVVSHGEIAAGCKTDPLGWDWERFRGLALRDLPVSEDGPAIVAPPATQKMSRDSLPDVAVVAPKPVTPSAPRPAPAQPRVAVVKPKPAHCSRTIWLNGATVLASGGLLIGESLDLAHRIGITLPVAMTKWALFFVGVVNIILRLRTNQPLACSAGTSTAKAEEVAARPPRRARPAFG